VRFAELRYTAEMRVTRDVAIAPPWSPGGDAPRARRAAATIDDEGSESGVAVAGRGRARGPELRDRRTAEDRHARPPTGVRACRRRDRRRPRWARRRPLPARRGPRPAIFEQGDGVGGQWRVGAPYSGVWPGMRTNTSRVMTAFSDVPLPPGTAMYPTAVEVGAYLERYAERAGCSTARGSAPASRRSSATAGATGGCCAGAVPTVPRGRRASRGSSSPGAVPRARRAARAGARLASPGRGASCTRRRTAARSASWGGACSWRGTTSARWRSRASSRCAGRRASWWPRGGTATCCSGSWPGCPSSTASTPGTRRWRRRRSRARSPPRR
jgi:hypothetical protein